MYYNRITALLKRNVEKPSLVRVFFLKLHQANEITNLTSHINSYTACLMKIFLDDVPSLECQSLLSNLNVHIPEDLLEYNLKWYHVTIFDPLKNHSFRRPMQRALLFVGYHKPRGQPNWSGLCHLYKTRIADG
jgi:hypothetical protein